MHTHGLIVGFVSQKGGVGKSTLARALAAISAHAGMRVRLADLDLRQETSLTWGKLRAEHGLAGIAVVPYPSAGKALESARVDELLILDAPAGGTRATLEIARAATLIVQPTGASLDDLRPGVLLFHELVAAGIPRERLVFALCRLLSDVEADTARHYLESAGYDVLPGYVPERTAFRDAHNQGRALTETKRALAKRLDTFFDGLYERITRAPTPARREVP